MAQTEWNSQKKIKPNLFFQKIKKMQKGLLCQSILGLRFRTSGCYMLDLLAYKLFQQPCPRLFVTIEFVTILAIFQYILWGILSGEGQSRMTFFWSCKIGSGLVRFLRELEDWYILICLRLSDSQKPEVTRFFETERKFWVLFMFDWFLLFD